MSALGDRVTPVRFELPAALEATEPPEARGVARDAVRLLVADERSGALVHARFHELPELLQAGDLLVVNDSSTLPAALMGRRADGFSVRVHVATRVPDLSGGWRVVELRSPDGAVPVAGTAGERIELAGGAELELVAPYLGDRLWVATFDTDDELTPEDLMRAHGDPIRYGYVRRSWPLEAYQNVYATTPGSVEMPSAGRPFTASLLARLAAHGIELAPITLHCGVSSPERGETPYPEQFSVPAATARRIGAARASGHRVIAVGTTVVRALESAVDAGGDGAVHAASGWTELVIDPDRDVRSVDGMITGWHEPEASHLLMLAALASEGLLARSYREALVHGYLWHEFGDSHLILR